MHPPGGRRLLQWLRTGDHTPSSNPYYNLEGAGIHFVASPRHADLLLVTGPVTRNMREALLRTYQATPPPRLVVAVGDCGCTGGIFGESYASCGAVANVLPVDVDRPRLSAAADLILRGILRAVQRGRNPSTTIPAHATAPLPTPPA